MIIMRSIKIKFLLLTFVLLIVYEFIFYLFFDDWSQHETILKSSVVLNYVVVHLDLKGSPPKLEYLESLLPTFVDLGVNGILMEYEDMFPYERRLVNLSARNCYDKTKLKKFLSKSVRSGVEIIPLVQTFGHMEYVLKLEEYKHLREVEKYPDSICPSNPESSSLIRDMLEQVINFHTSIMPLKHIHIGCDEVYSINQCNQCRKKKFTDVQIFSNHLSVVNLIVTDLSPHTRVLVWDDMLRGKRRLQFIELDLSNIEPVSWDYKPKLTTVSHANLYNYHKKFENIWIASAFKGADGSTRTIPNHRNRLINNLLWLHFIMNYNFAGESKVFNFKGIILTGWSRYSHMNPLCELLPASMPSLILNLILIQTMKNGIDAGDFTDIDDIFAKYLEVKFSKYVKCKNLLNISDLDQTVCSYESSNLYNELKNYIKLHSKINERYSKKGSALTHINYYSKVKRDMHFTENKIFWCNQHLQNLLDLEQKLRNYMSRYYEEDVIQEYINDKTYEDKTKVKNTLEMLKRYSEIRSWERKPVTATCKSLKN